MTPSLRSAVNSMADAIFVPFDILFENQNQNQTLVSETQPELILGLR